ncbi:DUF2306 domain-containing protein [Ancylobacter dichloromethanicus]|uniref:Membrane protein n=1 Tax=Ancylobacter dichloromethanicus TaxID=518825 RepID=A0A9W6J868_9HYPH|nr:DUF2306 domain-containing protein [Ancylobacter dichloromethanicus]MBS7554486.1 DUF2306 domain-containing protein [Ancylobacter dichloromethanicus]GLK71616.1 membrane protein [Ancylobacter dichloromethanicus]
MDLAPLLDASPAIRLHAFSAIAALGLGTVQFVAPKGTLPHRSFGWLWSGLMATVAVSSFWISGMRWIGPFGPIHLLSLLVVVTLPLALLRAHRGDVAGHAAGMTGLFYWGLIAAGLFTFWPGRIMNQVLFGG